MHQFRFSDLDEFSGALKHDSVEVVRLGPSGGLNGVDLIELPDMLVRLGHQETAWDCFAQTPDDALSIVLIWGYGDEARMYGTAAQDGTFTLSGPSSEFVSSVRSKGDYIFLPIPAKLLDERMLGDAAGDVMRSGFNLVGQASPSSMAMLRGTLEAMQHNAVALHGGVVDERMHRNMQNALLTAMHYVIRPELMRSDAQTKGLAQRTMMFRTALEQLRSSEARPMDVFHICERLGISEPELRALFLEFAGVHPIDMLQRFRMQRVHKVLLAGLEHPLAVVEAALNAGFWDMGRFNTEYLRVYGESPLETQKRSTGLVLQQA